MSGKKPSSRNLRGRVLPPMGIFLFIMCLLLLFLTIGQPPAINSLLTGSQQRTLTTVSDFPLLDYASLSFSDGSGLYRLYDRSKLPLLDIGQTYDLTVGHPRGASTRKGVQPNYTAIISMTGTDGTVITTDADYEAQSGSILLQLLSVCLLIMVLGLLAYIGFILLRTLLRFIR